MTWVRRDIITGLGAAILAASRQGMAMAQTPEDFRRQFQDAHAKALKEFPFPLIQAPGKDALEKWQELKASQQGIPVILGDTTPEAFSNLLNPFDAEWGEKRSAPEIIEAANTIRFPEDLIAKRALERSEALGRFEKELRENPGMELPSITEVDSSGNGRALSREEVIAQFRASGTHQPATGEWPEQASESAALSIVTDILSGEFLDNVYLTVLPTDDWTTIPAYLRWGNWNANPAPEHHVAALRKWRDHYGAELIGLSADVLNVRVTRKPQTKEEAMVLAREQYAYCSDIVDQGVGTLSQLAKNLTVHDWWYFWWD